MGKIYNLFSAHEAPPVGHSWEEANRLLPVIRKHTLSAIRRTNTITMRMESHTRTSTEFQKLAKQHEEAVAKWVEVVHRLGAVAKGLWLVDFDTGDGYLCWAYPEKVVEHYHAYGTGFKDRKKVKRPSA